MDLIEQCKTLMRNIYSHYHKFGLKVPVNHPGDKYIIKLDNDNIIDIERNEMDIIIHFKCVPCEHDMVKQRELRRLIE